MIDRIEEHREKSLEDIPGNIVEPPTIMDNGLGGGNAGGIGGGMGGLFEGLNSNPISGNSTGGSTSSDPFSFMKGLEFAAPTTSAP
jgi:hypothetical protein